MKINIVRQNRLKYQRAKLVRRINRGVTFGSLGLFLLSILWMSGQFIYLNIRQSALSKEVKQLQLAYASRAKDVVEYLAVKQVITSVNDIQSKRFRYKDFLNDIYALLPANAKLAGVDFGAKGVIVVNVRLTSLTDYDTMMANISSAGNNKNFLFSAAAEKQLTRDKNGEYVVSLELKIK